MSEELPARIAVVHDWLVDYAGSESALAEILQCLPQAHLFTLVDHMPAAERAPLGGRPARTSFLQDMPGVARHLAWYLPLMPLAIEQLDVTGYDLVVSSNTAVAKGVIVSPDALHLSYVNSPMRYAWDQQFEYLRAEHAERGLKSVLMRCLLHRLRIWDHRSAAGVDHFAANSRFIARRIEKSYRRDSEVIHPPVDTEFFVPGTEARGSDYLTVSRLVGYKRVDLLVQAFRELPERRLVIVGDGPDLRRLKASAGANVDFVGRLPRERLRARLQSARAFVFAAVEDFGIAPVEAMACGTPVIALARGGATDTVAGLDAAQPTGVLFPEQTAAAVAGAVRAFEANAARITAQACRARAERFSRARFRAEFTGFVTRKYAAWQLRR
ncbi:MAG TPA: glycosyltransferase [Burkholderiales bacterium]